MPTKSEVLTWLVEMQSDLINKPNLLKNRDAMGAWDSLTKLVQNREKDKFQTGFEYLENIIHRDFKVSPGKLLLQRIRYASGKEIILSTVESSGTAGVQKSTGSSPVPPSLAAKEKKKKTTPVHGIKANDGIIHVARPRTASGSREDDNEVKLFKLQHDYKEMERQLNDTQAKLRKTERDKEDLVERQKRFEELERQLKDTQENLRQSETDKEYWVGRMSKVTGDKLTRDNPDIADLSDPNRPTKLGEKYSLLYDNEWTDAMEKLTETTDSQISERRGIDILINILKKIHTLCIECADDQMKKLHEAVIFESRTEQNGIMDIPIAVQRSLQDAQKQTSSRSLPAVQEMVRTELESFKDQYGAIPMDKITPFVNKCTEICWGMVTQSPRMDFLFPEEGPGKRFDKDKFKEFTRSGDKMDYLVWPAMVIQKQGSLIAKGSVQAIARHT